MKKSHWMVMLLLTLVSCGIQRTGAGGQQAEQVDFIISFGSCNKHTLENRLWDDVLAQKPNVWVWGGDNVYADTENLEEFREIYGAQDTVKGYARLKKEVPIIGTWDDHDYGVNDGGAEFVAKRGSQEQFLDFLDIPKNDPRRQRAGIYAAHDFKMPAGTVKILVLDTRYFRTSLLKDPQSPKGYRPNNYGQGTILGEEQWDWLERELISSTANFNILVSSIQFLSDQHGFETWGNFPHEVDRLKGILIASKAKGCIIISGDRHISEFSKATVDGLSYPLIDFTSSGLTHAYSNFKKETNPYRVGQVVTTESFGLLKFNFERNTVIFQMIGDQGKVLGQMGQSY